MVREADNRGVDDRHLPLVDSVRTSDETVWKFGPLPIMDGLTLYMPEGAVPLYVELQGDLPWLWARVNPEAPKVPRNFRLAGTGHPLGPHVGRHIGSWQMHGGALVWHLFEMTQ